MNLQLTPLDWSRVDHLFEVLATNIDASNLINDFLQSYDAIASAKELLQLKKRYHLNDQQAMLRYLSKKLSGGRIQPAIEQLIQSHVSPNFALLDPHAYLENPFYRRVPPLDEKADNWHLFTTHYQAHEFFIYNDILVSNDNYQEHLRIGYFDQSFTYLAVDENQTNWMSITPNEIETMEQPLNQMHGHVLVLGLGLGYFAVRCAMKENVSQVTIVERDTRVINLFKTYILPHLNIEDKLTIIQADAISYLRSIAQPYQFDSTFIDLWHTADDGLPLYLLFNQIENRLSPESPFTYWIEESLLAMLRRVVLTVISEVRDGATDRDFQRRETLHDDLINAVYFYYQSLTLTSYEQLHQLLSNESLKQLATVLPFNYLPN